MRKPLNMLLRRTQMLDADLLQVDTEGYDAKIIGMIDFGVCRPRLIKFEHKNLSAEERASVVGLLSRNGYACVGEVGDTVAWLR